MLQPTAPLLHRPRRSVLFVPAINARAVEKAKTLPCDGVILDLEDSVAPEEKDQARQAVVAAALSRGFGSKELIVRVNALDSEDGETDVKALVRAMGDIDAILAPKVKDPVAPGRLAMRLGPMPDRVRLWLMIETCQALFHLNAIASVKRLSALVLGLNDLAAEMGARPGPDRAPLQAAMSLTVAAARAHGLAALDGVCNAFEDDLAFEREARQARAFGFDGKSLIHPRQIAPCNHAFTPAPQEVAWAQAVVAAFHQAGRGAGAVRVQGRMVEAMHLEQARRLLAAAEG